MSGSPGSFARGLVAQDDGDHRGTSRSTCRPAVVSGREFLAAGSALLALNLLTAALFWFNSAGGTGIGQRAFPIDDGWIHLVYARNLATTLRTDFNPGFLESGMTSPLWVILNALGYWPGQTFGFNPTVVPKALSLLFGALTALTVHLLLRQRGVQAPLAFGAACVLSIDPQWCFSRCSGMEVTLFAWLLLLALLTLECDAPWIAGCAIGLATLARPEGLLFAAATIPLAAALAPTGKRARLALALALPAGLLFGAWVAYNLAVTGHPLPNTFYIKAQSATLLRWRNLVTIIEAHVLGASFNRTGVGLILAVIGTVRACRRDRRPDLVIPLFTALFVLGISITHTMVQGRPYYWARYCHPFYPFLILLTALGAAYLQELAGRRARGPVPSLLLPIAVCATLVTPAALDFPATAALYSTNCRDIQEGEVKIGEWLRANTPPGSWVATMDAGAIRYFSERPVLDIIGLNDHRLAHGETLTARLLAVRPPHFVLFPRVFSRMIGTLSLQPLFSVTQNPYTICADPTQATLTVYRSAWAPR